jgi:hypothetical protein
MFAITANDGFYIRQINSRLRISVISLFDKRVYWNLDMTTYRAGKFPEKCGHLNHPHSSIADSF